jgi:hypothetical protein
MPGTHVEMRKIVDKNNHHKGTKNTKKPNGRRVERHPSGSLRVLCAFVVKAFLYAAARTPASRMGRCTNVAKMPAATVLIHMMS